MITFSLFLLLAGYVIGLGAVTVIEFHGFLARHSSYWTEATIRTHKITKPLIWTGLVLALCGGSIFFSLEGFEGATKVLPYIAGVLVLNGCFLTFVISPHLLKAEKAGRTRELLPKFMQRNITLSFFVSIIGWWGSLFIVVHSIAEHFRP